MATLLITQDLDCNVYIDTFAITNIDAAEQEKLEDFCPPTVVFGGTTDVTTVVTPLELADASGFALNDVVTATPSGATGTISHIDANIIYVSGVTGTFAVTNTIAGVPSGGASTISSVFTEQTLFEVQYGVVPNSTADFTKTQTIRQLAEGTEITYKFDGNTAIEAKENALDFVTVHKQKITEAWAEFDLQLDDFTGTESVNL